MIPQKIPLIFQRDFFNGAVFREKTNQKTAAAPRLNGRNSKMPPFMEKFLFAAVIRRFFGTYVI